MKNDMKWFLGAFLFVVALILALVLYKKLTVEYEGEREAILSELLAICKKVDKNATIRSY